MWLSSYQILFCSHELLWSEHDVQPLNAPETTQCNFCLFPDRNRIHINILVRTLFIYSFFPANTFQENSWVCQYFDVFLCYSMIVTCLSLGVGLLVGQNIYLCMSWAVIIIQTWDWYRSISAYFPKYCQGQSWEQPSVCVRACLYVWD